MFLGLSTLRDLIIRKPQGTDDFLQALLEVTLSDMELVRCLVPLFSSAAVGCVVCVLCVCVLCVCVYTCVLWSCPDCAPE